MNRIISYTQSTDVIPRGFFAKGEMQKEFEDAAFALQPGSMSGIIESASGLHIIERYVSEQRIVAQMLIIIGRRDSSEILTVGIDENNSVLPPYSLSSDAVFVICLERSERTAQFTLRLSHREYI